MTTHVRRLTALLLALGMLAGACSDDGGTTDDAGGDTTTTATASPDPGLTVEAVSTRPEMVTGGDVLVEVRGTDGSVDGLTAAVDGEPTDVAWQVDDTTVTGLVTGLTDGAHQVSASFDGEDATLEVTNHPVTGPVFSGAPLPLEACSTETFGLGAPVDDDCSAAETIVTWSYVSTDGDRVALDDPTVVPDDIAYLDDGTTPFILREEKGTINRSVYWITVLDPTPDPADPANWDSSAWNGRLVYEFGGGCGVTYSQGFKLLGQPDLSVLAAGYAHATATFNTFQVTCNATLSAETTMMVKEHFSEAYALPELTIGSGGSGGAIQQYQIAQNYPGLLDAAAPLLPFPDAISISTDVLDCGLLERLYRDEAFADWTAEAKLAVTGHANAGTCTFWEQTFVPNVNPTTGCTLDLLSAASGAIEGLADGVPPSVDDSLAYDPETNPDGLRCTLQDGNVNVLGRDPATGFALRPWDNSAVQYGLAALNEGAITPEQFVQLNESIGSFDIDGQWTTGRAVATESTIATAYASGMVNEGGGDLRRIPIIEVNLWTDDEGDIHTRDRAFAARERVRLEDGTLPPNLMLWTRGLPEGDTLVDSLTGSVGLGLEVVTVLDEWATALHEAAPDAATMDDAELATALESTRPDAAVDNCITADGERVSAVDLYESPGPCVDPYPVSRSPRTVSGAPLRNDILKCDVRTVADAVAAETYEVDLTDDQIARLEAVFPDGVCDWSKPGIGQVPVDEPWPVYGAALP